MTTLTRRLLLASSAVGAGAASTSTYVHYQLLTQSGYSSFCDINQTLNCTTAYLSRYGSFMGVPVALFGVLFFVVVLLLASLGGRKDLPARDAVPAYVFALSTIGFAFVLYLGWASYFVLKTFCVLCAITYVSTIALFIISGTATSVPMTSLPGRAWADARRLASSPLAFLVVILLLAGAGSAIAFFPREAAGAGQVSAPIQPLTEEQKQQLKAWWDVQPKEDVPIPDQGAKVVVLKFSDYMCPACRKTYEDYKVLEAKYRGNKDVTFIVKSFPLEGECNPNVPGGSHYASCEASAAVVMARSKGTAARLEEWLFTNQATLTPDSVKQAARDLGGIPDFDARYQGALQEVKMDASLGGLMKIAQTPTFFINGRRIVGGYAPQAMDGMIQLELERAK